MKILAGLMLALSIAVPGHAQDRANVQDHVAAAAHAGASVVLVHGGTTDGSGWKDVHDILREKGLAVTVVSLPHIQPVYFSPPSLSPLWSYSSAAKARSMVS